MSFSKLNRLVSRRTLLRGAGVTLALPWLESLQPRVARAQAAQPPRRFVPIYLPLGAPEFWKPQAAGSGAAWALSSVLATLQQLKTKVTVISGLENGSVFNANGSDQVEPSHARQAGAWLTCADADAVRVRLGKQDVNGISADQVLAADPTFATQTVLPSLQVGLSTVYSSCDGRSCALSRSVSWQNESTPLFKLVDPKKVFDLLVGAAGGPTATPAAQRERDAMTSVLDAVLEGASGVRPKLSAADRVRLDEFLSSVRSVELRAKAGMPAVDCNVPVLPPFAEVTPDGIKQTTATYDKGRHADLMNDMVAIALQCDLTRVVSYMLEDEDSEFTYDNVPKRQFDATTSTPAPGFCGNYSGAQHGSVDEFATITWWNVGRAALLCQKLAQMPEADGTSVLDNTVVFLGSCMHGSDHRCGDLPALLIGGGGGHLKTDQHVALSARPLRDLYFTLMNDVFGLGVADFGVNRTGAPIKRITELLA